MLQPPWLQYHEDFWEVEDRGDHKMWQFHDFLPHGRSSADMGRFTLLARFMGQIGKAKKLNTAETGWGQKGSYTGWNLSSFLLLSKDWERIQPPSVDIGCWSFQTDKSRTSWSSVILTHHKQNNFGLPTIANFWCQREHLVTSDSTQATLHESWVWRLKPCWLLPSDGQWGESQMEFTSLSLEPGPFKS